MRRKSTSGKILYFATYYTVLISGLTFMLVILRNNHQPELGVFLFVSLLLFRVGFDVWQHFRARRKIKTRRLASTSDEIINPEAEYILGDDGEIVEVVDDEKPKRNTDSTVK